MTRYQIVGLPDAIRYMPEGPDGADDPRRVEKIAAWIAWGEQVVAYRKQRWAACEGLIPGLDANKEQERERIICQHSPLYAITMYMHIYETDPIRLKRYPWYRKEHQGWLPAIPFHFHARLIDWLEARYHAEEGERSTASSANLVGWGSRTGR